MSDKTVLQDLARRYMDVCREADQDRRRNDWRRHNSLQRTEPLIYVRAFAWREMPQSKCVCEDSLAREYEDFLRQRLFVSTVQDDSIFEPWVTVNAVHRCAGWGVDVSRHVTDEPGGSFKIDYPLKSLADVGKLRAPWHEIDEQATAARVGQVRDLLGDSITVNVDRGPAYRMWTGDLSTDLGYLRGIENFMLDMLDDPRGLHALMRFMGEGVLRAHDQAEKAGHWGLCPPESGHALRDGTAGPGRQP